MSNKALLQISLVFVSTVIVQYIVSEILCYKNHTPQMRKSVREKEIFKKYYSLQKNEINLYENLYFYFTFSYTYYCIFHILYIFLHFSKSFFFIRIYLIIQTMNKFPEVRDKI